MNINSIKVKCDSELVGTQIKGEYKAKGEKMKKKDINVTKELIKNIEHFSIKAILREEN